jgi:hypothetical protein
MATPERVTVSSKDQLDNAISQYVGKGFTVANRTEKSATMQKPKKFSIPIAIIGFLLCIVGLIVYAIIYSMQPEVEVVEISIV